MTESTSVPYSAKPVTVIAPKMRDAVEKDTGVLVQRADEIQVVDDVSYENAGEFLRDIKTHQKRVGEMCQPAIASANKAHKDALELRNTLLAGSVKAERVIKARMAEYQMEVDRKRREAEERAARERQKAIEEEQLRRAAELEAQGHHEAAERALTDEHTPAPLPPPVTVAEKPSVKGIATREVWSAEVTDLKALVQAWIDGEVPANAILPNEKLIAKMGRTLQSAFRWPGCRATRTTGIAAQARRSF